MIKVAIINLKGGVGKSVTACNLACLLTELLPENKNRVLVVDLDKQANATKFFNRLTYNGLSSANVLMNPSKVYHAIYETDVSDHVDILPANMQLLTANRQVLMDVTRRQQDRLTKALADDRLSYDWCIMDCPPDIDMASINALCAADYVIIPIDCDEWALDGLDEIVDQVRQVQEYLNPSLELMGCLVTKYDHTNHAVRTIEKLVATGLPVFRSIIRQAVAVKEAKAAHLPLHLYSSKSGVTEDYIKLAKEIIAAAGGEVKA